MKPRQKRKLKKTKEEKEGRETGEESKFKTSQETYLLQCGQGEDTQRPAYHMTCLQQEPPHVQVRGGEMDGFEHFEERRNWKLKGAEE